MLDDNTKQVNRIIANTLARTSILMIVLLITTITGIFDSTPGLIIVIASSIIMVSLLPSLLLKLKVPDSFLKHYMLMSISALICVLGTSNNIGIFITYMLVPIISCLYFDKKFTFRISIFSYITMAIGVYINCAGKLEVTYLEWSHLKTFRNYFIGFSIEYLMVMLFVMRLVSRSQSFLEQQQEHLRVLQEENDKQKRMTSVYQNTVSPQKNSALSIISKDIDNLTPDCQAKLSSGHRVVVSIQEMLMYADNTKLAFKQALEVIGEYFKLDRIIFIEMLEEEEKSSLSLQWNRDRHTRLENYVDSLPKSVQEEITTIYKQNGYMEIGIDFFPEPTNDFARYMIQNKLGVQLWLPALVDGKYMGAMCFDKKNCESYTTVEKFLLTEVAGIIATHLMRMNADKANQAKSNFLSSMSHEIRTPMNAIMGMTSVALREEVSPNVRKSLNIIRSSSEGLLSIINDILDFSKIESGRIEIIPEEYKVLSLINDVSVMANARNAEKGLDIRVECPDDLPTSLYGDFVRIKQVMVNLVTNSIKYTSEGSVTLRVSCKDIDAGTVMFHFEVEDTGQGIKKEDIGKLFMSYSQVNQDINHHTEGTGLGLTISKQFVELMDGHIGVESEYGKGSTFFFDIPQLIVDRNPAGPLEDFDYQFEAEAEEEYKATGARVLIVDDNEMNLMIEEALFEPFELDITLAKSGREAIRILKEKEFEIIFMDHFMPEMDGVEATDYIRKMEGNPNQHIPIIALTADAVSGVKEEMLAAGMDDFLSKPIEMKDAIRIFKKYLKR